MNLHNIKQIQSHWVDNCFRWLRKLFTLENSITVLLTAEIIAATYYKALKESTQSKLLGIICNQILKDEEMHLHFQSFCLSYFYRKKNFVHKIFIRKIHKILTLGTIIIVWFDTILFSKKQNFLFLVFLGKYSRILICVIK